MIDPREQTDLDCQRGVCFNLERVFQIQPSYVSIRLGAVLPNLLHTPTTMTD
ncbi:hypothetical protein J6590_040046 [Homalodisca vitripennis]|nr:hypothetical protein J6590_040046 [Homalodisca vitripennis]